MIASRPSTPVAATAFGSVPLYDVPIMPTRPVAHDALVWRPFASTAVVRPLSQSMTALIPSVSLVRRWSGSPATRRCPRTPRARRQTRVAPRSR